MTAAVRTYRALTRLYPRWFRDAYRDDLVLLFEDQLREEPAPRVLARTALDLLLSVPTTYLEKTMPRATTTVVPVIFGALGVGSLLAALVVGSEPVWLLAGLVVAALCGVVARAAARSTRPIVDRPATASWWRLLLVGPALLALFFGVTTATGELPEGGWFVGMFVLLVALVTTVAGVGLGIAHAVRTHARPAT